MKIKNNTLDAVGFSSSLICAIHCALIPVLLSFTSLSSLHFLANPYIEWSFIGLGIVFAILSLLPSYKRVHRNIRPLSYAMVGFLFIALGRFHFTDLWESANTVLGAFLVALSHYFNWKYNYNIKNPK